MKSDSVYDAFERDLKDFFSDITYVDSNPYEVHKEEVYKEGEEIKNKVSKEIYELENIVIDRNCYSLMLCEKMSLTDYILSKVNEENFKISFWSKIFKGAKTIINEEISNRISDNSFIITSPKIKDLLGLNCGVFTNMNLVDYILIGKKSEIIIHKEIEELQDNFIKIYYYFNVDNFKVIKVDL